jgi:hypothetical protein
MIGGNFYHYEILHFDDPAFKQIPISFLITMIDSKRKSQFLHELKSFRPTRMVVIMEISDRVLDALTKRQSLITNNPAIEHFFKFPATFECNGQIPSMQINDMLLQEHTYISRLNDILSIFNRNEFDVPNTQRISKEILRVGKSEIIV